MAQAIEPVRRHANPGLREEQNVQDLRIAAAYLRAISTRDPYVNERIAETARRLEWLADQLAQTPPVDYREIRAGLRRVFPDIAGEE